MECYSDGQVFEKILHNVTLIVKFYHEFHVYDRLLKYLSVSASFNLSNFAEFEVVKTFI
jgi:hypothetical protein